AFHEPVDRARFEQSINEGSHDPIPSWMTQFDSQIGFAIRAHCAPLLDLDRHAPADAYWERRVKLGEQEVTRRFLRAAGVSDWLLDTGYRGPEILRPEGMAAASGAAVHEIVRIESVAESLVADGVAAADYAEAFRSALRTAAADAVGLKTVVAYRCGFDLDWTVPAPAEVVDAARRWIGGGGGRLADQVLLRFGVHAALELGLPLQFHVGFGDRDLDLHQVNPSLLMGLLRQPAVAAVPIMLLHCYPYHREAGYLAQAFNNVYCDVGEALNYVGSRAASVIAEVLELAPFAKVLYSSDAWGPAELHYLGARLWRDGLASVFGRWVSADEWSQADAIRIAEMMCSGNARRVYRLDERSGPVAGATTRHAVPDHRELAGWPPDSQ
ncbi:MAG TPA: amidohydrolase family protein, partial [Jatrophihabitans sp.]|nr:amidohydrolase family protein [Jatrophihabitans sp.]